MTALRRLRRSVRVALCMSACTRGGCGAYKPSSIWSLVCSSSNCIQLRDAKCCSSREIAAQALGDKVVCKPIDHEKLSSRLRHPASGANRFNMQLTESTPWKIETNLRHAWDLVFSISRNHVHVCSLSIFNQTLAIHHGQNGPQTQLLDGE